MRLVCISYRPKVAVFMTAEEIEIALECSRHHYDAKCKGMSRDDGGRPGLLVCMRNYRRNVPEGDYNLTLDDLDTIAKVLEVGHYFPDKEKAIKAVNLGFAIGRIFRKVQEHPCPSIELNQDVSNP